LLIRKRDEQHRNIIDRNCMGTGFHYWNEIVREMKPSYSYTEVMYLIDVIDNKNEFQALNFVLLSEMARYPCNMWWEIRTKMNKRMNQLLR
jgi:hypothetical protein